MDYIGDMGIGVNGYGLVVTAGIAVGTFIAGRVAKKKNIWDVLAWVVISGVIGARAYHVIDWWWYYRDNLGLIPAVWTGGLGIFGGIAGGVMGLWLWCKKNKQSWLKWLDVIAVGAPLGQAIGRWGNFFNQELYGKPFDYTQGKPPFWAIYIKAEGGYFHPLFAYESMWNLVIFAIVWRLAQKRVEPGTIFAVYLGGYSLGRFGLEWLRIDSWVANKIISLFLVVISWMWVWIRNKKSLSFS